ncbi:MAG: sugar phosphate isomerase/epimerase [Desulfobacteraceae bacterium]|nr:sugar phosphate isomerase/epimerase [Desulfobacteraceae bacterium]
MRNPGLKISAVGTGAGKVLQQLHLTSPDKDVRRRAGEFIHNMIDFAGRLKAPVIIGSMQGQIVEGVERQQALAWLSKSLEDLGQHADELGVRVLLEPLNRYETNVINRLADGVDLVSSLTCESVFLLADLFHMNIEEKSIAEAIRAADKYIEFVHFSDSNRRPVGMRHTDLRAVANALQEINYDGYLSAEALCYPDPDGAAAQTIAAFGEFFA